MSILGEPYLSTPSADDHYLVVVSSILGLSVEDVVTPEYEFPGGGGIDVDEYWDYLSRIVTHLVGQSGNTLNRTSLEIQIEDYMRRIVSMTDATSFLSFNLLRPSEFFLHFPRQPTTVSRHRLQVSWPKPRATRYRMHIADQNVFFVNNTNFAADTFASYSFAAYSRRALTTTKNSRFHVSLLREIIKAGRVELQSVPTNSRAGRYRLNVPHDLTKAGQYWVEISDEITHASRFRLLVSGIDSIETNTQFHILIEEAPLLYPGVFRIALADISLALDGHYWLNIATTPVLDGQYFVLMTSSTLKPGQYYVRFADQVMTLAAQSHLLFAPSVSFPASYVMEPATRILLDALYRLMGVREIERTGTYRLFNADIALEASGAFLVQLNDTIAQAARYHMQFIHAPAHGAHFTVQSSSTLDYETQYLLERFLEEIRAAQYRMEASFTTIRDSRFRVESTATHTQEGRFRLVIEMALTRDGFYRMQVDETQTAEAAFALQQAGLLNQIARYRMLHVDQVVAFDAAFVLGDLVSTHVIEFGGQYSLNFGDTLSRLARVFLQSSTLRAVDSSVFLNHARLIELDSRWRMHTTTQDTRLSRWRAEVETDLLLSSRYRTQQDVTDQTSAQFSLIYSNIEQTHEAQWYLDHLTAFFVHGRFWLSVPTEMIRGGAFVLKGAPIRIIIRSEGFTAPRITQETYTAARADGSGLYVFPVETVGAGYVFASHTFASHTFDSQSQQGSDSVVVDPFTVTESYTAPRIRDEGYTWGGLGE